ncbi:hypothetical protein [Streptomyces scopuliridis]|uniref:hypothetical protein n=1 Tax=Streptomyces scopuliridis TaxID=452529 RepID=UPI0036875E31
MSFGQHGESHGGRHEAEDAAAELEELGYGTLWLGGSPGGNPGGDLVTAVAHRFGGDALVDSHLPLLDLVDMDWRP